MAEPIVTGVDFTTVATSDHDAACRFYGEVLGLERSKSWGDHPATEFETGTLTIAVIDWTAFGRDNQPNPNPIVLQVADVPAAKAELDEALISVQAQQKRENRVRSLASANAL